MTKYLEYHTKPENETVTLQCVTSGGLPRATVRWYRIVNDGLKCIPSDEITTGINVQVTTVDGLNITSSTLQYTTSRNDNGAGICCFASNVQGQEHASRITRLNVQYPPSKRPFIADIKGNSDFYVLENTLVNLTCSVTGGNPLANLTLLCYGKTGGNQTISDQTVTRSVLLRAPRGDERQCRCTAKHVAGPARDIVANVKVLYSPITPTLTVQSQQVLVVHLTEGDPLTVSCNSSSVPPADTYKWILPDGTTRPGQQLHIDKMRYHYNLVYTCVAENHMMPSQGPTVVGTSSAPLAAVLSYSPRHAYRHQYSEDVVVTAGQRAVLSITLAAYPLPSVHLWTKWKAGIYSNVHNDTNTVMSTIGLTLNLKILTTKPDDFAQYMVTVSNGIGLPYNYTFFLRETDSVSDTNPRFISGVVGGTAAFAVVVVVAAVIVICLARRKPLNKGGQTDTSYKSSTQQVQNDDVEEQAPSGESYPGSNIEADISPAGPTYIHAEPTYIPAEPTYIHAEPTYIHAEPTYIHAEPTPQSEYIGLAQYGNIQNPYEDLGAEIDCQMRTEKTYTNVIS